MSPRSELNSKLIIRLGDNGKIMSLQQRIIELFRDNPGRKPAHLAAYLKISRGSVSCWMSGKTRTISGDNAHGVAKYFGVNAEWVQSGKGKKYPDPTTGKFNAQDISFIPVIPWSRAGTWRNSPNGGRMEALNWIPCPQADCNKNTFALTLVDDSMQNPYPGQRSYPVGSLIYVDPDKIVESGCRVVVSLNNEVLFREYRKDGGKFILKALNPQYLTHDVSNDLQIIGVVIGQFLAE